MNERNEKPPSEGEAKQAPPLTETQADPSHHEAAEIEGWALQWDASALKKVNMARKMRELRQSPTDR